MLGESAAVPRARGGKNCTSKGKCYGSCPDEVALIRKFGKNFKEVLSV